MKNSERRKGLRQLRDGGQISVALAAMWAWVDQRTWRSWETGDENSTARSPSPAALWSFFARSGLSMQSLNKPGIGIPRARAIAIGSYKGGVGKTPITVNVAASLVEAGYRVAVVTSDLVYRHACEDGESAPEGSLASRIDFYDELDIVTFPKAIKKKRKAMAERLAILPPEEEERYRRLHAEDLEALARKQKATESLKTLISKYDYLLIDANGDLELIRRFSDLVAVVVDTNCSMAVRSAQKFVRDIRAIKCRETAPGYFGLLTNCDVGGLSHELEEFVGDHVDLDDDQWDSLAESRISVWQRRERVLNMVDSLPFPLLHTELTASYRAAIEMYEHEDLDRPEYGYYSAYVDFAPRSHAAREIRRLADELINWRL